jgi:NAD(P)-dependent dehydrogenase (short-subunit alcohol dehydrogenase family)
MLLAGGGTNNPMTNYSAYCAAKIALIKMCELIDDEEAGINAFIIGPGFVRTRIHEETLRAGAAAGAGLDKTRAFLATPGSSHDHIYSHMTWCIAQGRAVAGGRNFSTVHDPWRGGGAALAADLKLDPDAFRLRRRPTGAG